MAEEIPKLTTEQIYAVLANKIGSRDFELINYEFRRLGNKIGLVCDHVTITTTVNIFSTTDKSNSYPKNIQTFKFFAKFFPKAETQVTFCKETGAFAKEIFMYELLGKIKSSGTSFLDCVPNCFYTKEDFVIVTEDLIEMGYQLVSKNEDLDYNTVLTVIRSLAKLHASSILFEENESKRLGVPYTLDQDHEDDFAETTYHTRNDTLRLNAESAVKGIFSEIELFNCPKTLKSGKDFVTLAKEICVNIFDLVKRSSKYRNVLCHGDLWATNFLLKYNAKNQAIDCKFVDFQGGRYLPPSHDLMSFLYLTTTREFRRKHMYDIIGLYYFQLEKILKLSHLDIKNILPFSKFMDSCEEQKPFAIYQSATHFQLILIDNERLHDLFSDVKFSEHTFSVDRTDMILANIDVNDNYRRKLEESILDLQDYCESL